MEKIKLDVIIPSLNEDSGTLRILEQLKTQKNVEINKIVLPITMLIEKPENDLHENIKSAGNIVFFDVKPSEFSHSLTREKAIREYCKSRVVVMMSHDIKLIDENALYNIAKNVDNGTCAYAYGRQVCPKKCIEMYVREKNYPAESYLVKKEDIERLQTMAFFSSDAFSCLDRDVFIKIGGYQGQNLITNEDMFYSYYVLHNGYAKMYCADAVIEHFHKYKLKEIYHRYYTFGQFYKQVSLFDGYKNSSAGFSLAMRVLGQAFKHFDIQSIFMWLPNMASRYLGFKKGRK